MRNLENAFSMENAVPNSTWNPIATTPNGVELELCVSDSGGYHALVVPCRRNGVGWFEVRLNRMVPIRPTHWRLWPRERK